MSAQSHKGYGSIGIGADYLDHSINTLSGNISGGGIINKSLLLGVGVGITSINHIKGLYVPLFVDINLSTDFRQKLFPVAILRPGYAIYSRGEGVGRTIGAGAHFAGVGLGVTVQKTKFMVAGGFNQTGFKVKDLPVRYKGFGVRAGVYFTPSL